ncbi:alanine or glycine:cation symporter, AGCS family [Halobacillus karajensis]|uniref:Amino-acid carrier protein AlsT n=1 Tax=Halobacillus karajensis TaxID=195088 RepID=A0A024P3H6_9BACI|nr:alanine/glycine:cation symporter family protein [Halobacillus karajensis]CDQ18724.1 Amino-acid carrier protein AlsT [Halobacillus karajensis]CDQ23204.1 Amino-acid carrier protein AlsT [Halobacillus karajensis]CDQ26686.1 Amino-acid carrier protein AlsT [Halobacillus karajensis]SEH47496.1 alanine or glycine:cation symporter, AGCS family [Halobacillus karajensis]
MVENILTFLNDWMWGTILVVALLGLGLWFSIRLNFAQFRYIPEMIRVLFDKRSISAGGKKGTSPFQAFAISTASRVGTGNLAGVAAAITVGGPGAVFWMWIVAILGGASSFIESTLAQVYKVPDKNQYRGGPAYYIEKGLKNRGLGIVFAITITFTYGLVFSSVQSNTIRLAFENSFNADKWLVGGFLTFIVAIIIFGGLKRIAQVTQFIIPIMAIFYIIISGYVLIVNIGQVPEMFGQIFAGAFGFREFAGGTFGAMILIGIKRGLFSNEAGMGSAPNAAATSEVTHPVKQGLIQTLGVFTDTLLICSATAVIILFAGDYAGTDLDGIQLTQAAFESQLGTWAAIFIAIAIFLFAFSSIIGNYYYGETNIEFIKTSKPAIFLYRVGVLLMVLFGAIAEFGLVWSLADLTMGIMALINLYAIFRLSSVAYAALKDYKTQRKAGKDPVFYQDHLPGVEGMEYWRRDQTSEKEEG